MSCRLYVSSKGIHGSGFNSNYFDLSCQPYTEGEEYFYIRVSSSLTDMNELMIMCVGQAHGSAVNEGS